MIKQTILAIAFATLATSLSAQDYITFDLGGGLQNISFKNDQGDKKVGFGFDTQLGYRHFFNDNWGAGIGIGFKTFAGKATVNFNHNEQNGEDPAILAEHKERNYLTEYSSVEEKVKLSAVDVPIGGYYQRSFNDKWSMCAGLNIFVTIAASSKFESESGNVTVKAEYPSYKQTAQDVPAHGLGTYSGFSGSPDLKKLAVGLGAEYTMYYALSDCLDLGMGINGAYRFSDLKNQNFEKLYDEDARTYNGITQSKLCDAVRLVNLTATVGIRYHLPSK